MSFTYRSHTLSPSVGSGGSDPGWDGKNGSEEEELEGGRGGGGEEEEEEEGELGRGAGDDDTPASEPPKGVKWVPRCRALVVAALCQCALAWCEGPPPPPHLQPYPNTPHSQPPTCPMP